MCNSFCIFSHLNTNKFIKYSNILNILQIIINSFIIIISLLCFISCNLDLIIKTGYSNYINNIFFCLFMLIIIALIKYYHYKKILIKDKKQTSLILICLCFCVTITKCFSCLFAISKMIRIYRLIKIENSKEIFKVYKQADLLLIYLIILLGLFIILGIFWLIYMILIYNLRIIILNNDINNIYYNRNNISYMSTKPDLDDNSQEIAINNLNEGYKNNNFNYFSQNIINNIQKEYENKEAQTNIKGLI